MDSSQYYKKMREMYKYSNQNHRPIENQKKQLDKLPIQKQLTVLLYKPCIVVLFVYKSSLRSY